uniref:hypothetical protein n=1 Tax=Thauera sp. SDU_THAU2 TaxID=3136633 RepID=UPI00311E999E
MVDIHRLERERLPDHGDEGHPANCNRQQLEESRHPAEQIRGFLDKLTAFEVFDYRQPIPFGMGSLIAIGDKPILKQIDRRLHHIVPNVDIALGRRQVPVSRQCHDDLRADTGMGKLGDEPASSAMRRCTIGTGKPI